MPCALSRLGPELARLAPREVVVCEGADPTIDPLLAEILRENGAALSPLSRASFDSTSAQKRLCALWQVATLDAFGSFGRAEISALGAIVDYLDLTQRGRLPLLQPPLREDASRAMQIDAATRRNLELVSNLSGGRDGALLTTIDHTVTAAGGRLLESRLA